ncbi:hypothetical protein NRB16_05450 [Pseudomonas sp. LJDD11]|uniref:hypothetical protein n=1 Tax=Pseudomonas sp. LJDD11 TaxID=2931984 RepID=UPI00211BB0AF|nr:hypothetical protein [Pseudomonas sp. LJDD11]MCQ9422973.1 hypothetical protein [Pseudomonas sp. LJDD11]
MPVQHEHDPRLKKSLKTRHISMLALGGVIGAGLFVGSSAVIASTGPGAFLTYIVTGIIVALVMRMLGEMAAAHPRAKAPSSITRAWPMATPPATPRAGCTGTSGSLSSASKP